MIDLSDDDITLLIWARNLTSEAAQHDANSGYRDAYSKAAALLDRLITQHTKEGTP